MEGRRIITRPCIRTTQLHESACARYDNSASRGGSPLPATHHPFDAAAAARCYMCILPRESYGLTTLSRLSRDGNGRLRHGTRNTWHGFSVESRVPLKFRVFVFPRPKQTKKIRDDPETLSVRALTLRAACQPNANPFPISGSTPSSLSDHLHWHIAALLTRSLSFSHPLHTLSPC